jgi:uncharacterized membrane protein HdeD (DUF308 family)
MIRAETRIILALLAVFAALAGIGVFIHGLLSDSAGFVRYGAAALIAGVASFVLLLNPTARDDA